jgi:hypothetical protein
MALEYVVDICVIVSVIMALEYVVDIRVIVSVIMALEYVVDICVIVYLSSWLWNMLLIYASLSICHH